MSRADKKLGLQQNKIPNQGGVHPNENSFSNTTHNSNKNYIFVPVILGVVSLSVTK